MIAKLQTQKKYHDGFDDRSHRPHLLTYKPMLKQRKIPAKAISKAANVSTALAVSMPFQPSVWDKATIQSVCNHVLEMVESKLGEISADSYSRQILSKLNTMFTQLDFNTHRKSVIIQITPEEEKIMYLDFPLKPMAVVGASVSIFDLITNVQREPDFYCYVLNQDNISLYDYSNGQLHKMYEEQSRFGLEVDYHHAVNILEIFNNKHEKPVFVSGPSEKIALLSEAANDRVTLFILPGHLPYSKDEKFELPVGEIIYQWNLWETKFVQTRLFLAKKTGSLITHLDNVLISLKKSANGLLLLDKTMLLNLRRSSLSSELFNLAGEVEAEIEKFLRRGNRIEMTGSGLLQIMGGIALIRYNKVETPAFRTHYEQKDLY